MSENKPKTILIIEDSVTQALSLRMLLENNGLQVLCAPDGQKGISMAHSNLPEVIVLDIEMPGISGFEVAVQLSREPDTAHIPIIMLTSHDNVTALRKSLVLGAIDFIPKDVFSDAVLLETLRQLNILDSEQISGENDVENEA